MPDSNGADTKQQDLPLDDDKKEETPKVNVEALYKKIEALEKKLEEKSVKTQEPIADKMLDEKVKEADAQKSKSDSEAKTLESALRFNLESERFLKQNASVLPDEINKIFEQADKEKYDSAMDKANATKSAIINSFFSLQANMDLLTPSQQSILSDFLKYTKKAKEEKAEDVYRNIFEPTLAMIKRVKKAEQIAKANAGIIEGTEFDEAYAKKMREISEKYYFRTNKGV